MNSTFAENEKRRAVGRLDLLAWNCGCLMFTRQIFAWTVQQSLVRRQADSAHKNLVQHQVDHNPGYRDVHPDSEGVWRDGFVPREIALQRARKSDEDERHNHHGQDGVRDQDGEV